MAILLSLVKSIRQSAEMQCARLDVDGQENSLHSSQYKHMWQQNRTILVISHPTCNERKPDYSEHFIMTVIQHAMRGSQITLNTS